MKYIRKYQQYSQWEDDEEDRLENVPVVSWIVNDDEVMYDHEPDLYRVVLTSRSNPEVFTILDEAGFDHEDPDGYTAAELGEITDEDFYSSTKDSENNDYYYSIFFNSDIQTFNEFQYFTGITELKHLAFTGCRDLSTITLPNSITAIYGNSSAVLSGIGYNSYVSPFYNTNITSIVIPNSVTTIGKHAFTQCTTLNRITIPDTITTVDGSAGFNDTEWYNNQSDGLIYIANIAYKYKGNMPSNTTITVRNGCIGISSSCFNGCSGLTSIVLPNTITKIGLSAFSWCSNLGSVYINDITAWCGIDFDGNDSNPLYKAHNLYLNNSIVTDIVIPNSVTTIKRLTFCGCGNLTSVTIPNSVTEIGALAFSYCTGSDASVTIGNSVTTIGSNAFRGFTSLTSLTIGNSVTTIDNYAFYDCSGLTSLTIPNSVTIIWDEAFRNCRGLTSVTIGNSVTTIGSNVFNSCNSIDTITSFAITAPTIQTSTFYGIKANGILHVPSGSNYSTWMGTSNYYLGKYNWTIAYDA